MAAKKKAKKTVKHSSSVRSQRYTNNTRALLGFGILVIAAIEFAMFAMNVESIFRKNEYYIFLSLFGLQMILVFVFLHLISRE